MFPSQSLNKQANMIYLDAMTEIYQHLQSPERFDAAISDCINSCKFMPTVAEIRERAGMISVGQEQQAASEAAWDFVRRYVREWYGVPGKWPRLPESIDRAVRAVGGIAAIAEATADRLGFVRRDFVESFKSIPAAREYETRQGWTLPSQQEFARLMAGKQMPQLSAAALVSESASPAPKRYNFSSLSDEQLEAKKAQALQVAKKFHLKTHEKARFVAE
jgi:hypothetical protein